MLHNDLHIYHYKMQIVQALKPIVQPHHHKVLQEIDVRNLWISDEQHYNLSSYANKEHSCY